MYSPLSIFVCAGRPLVHIKMKGRPVNMNSARQRMLKHKVQGRKPGRPINPMSARQRRMANPGITNESPVDPEIAMHLLVSPVDPEIATHQQIIASERTNMLSFLKLLRDSDNSARLHQLIASGAFNKS